MSSGARRPGGLASQLDSLAMDEEVSGMLLAPIVGSGRVAGMLVRLGMVGCSLLPYSGQTRTSSYGSRLENLDWVHGHSGNPLTIRQILLYSLLAVVPGDLHGQLRDRMLSAGWADYSRQDGHGSLAHPSVRRRLCWDLLVVKLELLAATIRLLNFLLFLRTAQHPSFLLRLLNIHLLHPHNLRHRSQDFHFLNRQIVWQALTDFVLFLLPLIDLRRLRLRVRESLRRIGTQVWGSEVGSVQVSGRRMVPRRVATDRCGICSSAQMTASGGGGGLPMDPNEPLRVSPLPSSGSTLKLPYQVNCCGARYCYACLLSDILRWRELHLHDNRPWPCWICTSHPSALSRWNPAPLSN